MEQRKRAAALLCGLLGCACFGAGDWLMIYGDPSYQGTLSWLTEGAAQIAPWRNALAMGLAFPGILLYGTALFALQGFLPRERQRAVYHYLTAFGLTPWLALHLFYCMILYLFAWLRAGGYAAAALPAAQALFAHFWWLVPVSEAMMLPPFLYWSYVLASGNSVFPRWTAAANPLVFYLLLSVGKVLLPDTAFRIGFINGLMSESMAVWFLLLLLWSRRYGIRRSR